MSNFWKQTFSKKQNIWGNEPSDSAIMMSHLFHEHGIKRALVPGIGYGRNAIPFINNGIQVTGIEISPSAIHQAKKQIGSFIKIHEGSVTQMPFDNKKYDGIFCYALLHLLNKHEPNKFIKDCYHQLNKDGLMAFVVISDENDQYGKGKKLSYNRFKTENGLNVFFYNKAYIKKEFEHYTVLEIKSIKEPIKFMENYPPLCCFIILCGKQ